MLFYGSRDQQHHSDAIQLDSNLRSMLIGITEVHDPAWMDKRADSDFRSFFIHECRFSTNRDGIVFACSSIGIPRAERECLGMCLDFGAMKSGIFRRFGFFALALPRGEFKLLIFGGLDGVIISREILFGAIQIDAAFGAFRQCSYVAFSVIQYQHDRHADEID